MRAGHIDAQAFLLGASARDSGQMDQNVDLPILVQFVQFLRDREITADGGRTGMIGWAA